MPFRTSSGQAPMSALPQKPTSRWSAANTGAVLGVDIGWAPKDSTTGVCRLDWTSNAVSVVSSCAPLGRRRDLLCDFADRELLVSAFDGPLRGDLAIIGHYRLAEQLLTERLGQHIGKPGQSSSPVGKLLNFHASECARILLGTRKVAGAVHDHAIHSAAIVEAFPSSFLGVLIEHPEDLTVNRASRSDIFYRHLAQSGRLGALLEYLLPGRSLKTSFTEITHHDERAAAICALAALCVAAGHYTAVGDKTDGWIILPPRSFIQPWAWMILERNGRRGGLTFRPAE
jgi:hypothetical protein